MVTKKLPQWIENLPKKYVYFYDKAIFLVHVEEPGDDGQEPLDEYDLIYADCSGQEMKLKFCYTGITYDYHWDQVTSFCLIEGRMPQDANYILDKFTNIH